MSNLTEEQAQNILDKIAREREHLLEIERNINKTAETYTADTKAKLKKEYDEIAKLREDILPRLEDVKKREDSISSREQDVSRRESAVKVREELARTMNVDQDARDKDLSVREKLLKDGQFNNQQQVEKDNAVIKNGYNQLALQKKAHEGAMAVDMVALLARETAAKNVEKEWEGKLAAAQILQDDAAKIKVELQNQLGDRKAEFDNREKALDARQLDQDEREKKIGEQAAKLRGASEENAAESDRLRALQNGLEKAKLDVENKEMELKKLQHQVDTIVKNRDLKADLAALNGSPVETVSVAPESVTETGSP